MIRETGSSETERSGRYRAALKNSSALVNIGFALSLSLFLTTSFAVSFTTPVLANGGDGGDNAAVPGSGGHGGTPSNPDGEDGAGHPDGGGGGGGGSVDPNTGTGGTGGSGGPDTWPGEQGGIGGGPGRVSSSSSENNTANIAGGVGRPGWEGPGAGGGGGGGGVGWLIHGAVDGTYSNSAIITGGNGGGGGGGGPYGGSGGGGEGASGIVLWGGGVIDLSTSSRVQGGQGGDGALAGAGTGGGGGTGGTGIVMNDSGSILNAGQIIGGDGGAGGQGGFGAWAGMGADGDGADGGAGIVMNYGGSIFNAGQIIGGDGGAGGTGATYGAHGLGGAGIVGSNLSIVTSGEISGGLGGDGITQADAITFTGGSNRLELHDGYSFTGNVVSQGGGAALALGGDASPADAFDVGSVASTGLFQGFASLVKSGGSTWELTGATTDLGQINVDAGELYLNGASVGNGSAPLVVGLNETATLRLSNGAQVTSLYGDIGASGSSHGRVIVDGDGTVLRLSRQLFVGYYGEGTVAIENGGRVEVAESMSLGRWQASDHPPSHGTVTVTGQNSLLDIRGGVSVGDGHTGDLIISDGGRVNAGDAFIIGDQAASRGTVLVGSDAFLNIGSALAVGLEGEGTLTVANGGAVSVAGDGGSNLHTVLGFLPGSSGTINIGSAAGENAAAPGTIDTGRIDLYEGEATLVFNHTGDAYEFAVPLESVAAGNHRISHLSGVTLLTANSAGFEGETTVFGGSLLVGTQSAHTLGGNIEVLDGGTLGGSGTVGSGAGSQVTIGSGGILSAGNGLGMLTVDGDLTFMPGAFFDVDVDDVADHVDVRGTATLAGTVRVDAYSGAFTLGDEYTILSATSLVDRFEDEVGHNYAFLTPVLDHDDITNEVYLRLVRATDPDNPDDTIDFSDPTSTPNQGATADAVESLGEDDELFEVIVHLPEDAVEPAFDALSGEIHVSARSALIEESRFPRQAANDRIRAAFGAVAAGNPMPVMAYGPDGPVVTDGEAPLDGLAAWGRAYGNWGRIGGDGNASRLETSTGGLLIGADAGMAESWRLGLMAGYGRSSFHRDNRTSSASSDNYHLGLYGGTQWDALSLRGGLAHTWHDIETSRSVVIPGLTDNLQADYSARTFQVFGEAGYGIDLDEQSRFEPFVSLAHVRHTTSGFTEEGGAAALHVMRGSTNVTFTTLGVRGEHDISLGESDLTLHGTIGWRHAFGDIRPEGLKAFTGGDIFQISGAPIARNSAVIEAGLDFDISPDATVGLSYAGQFGGGDRHHGVRANLGVRF